MCLRHVCSNDAAPLVDCWDGLPIHQQAVACDASLIDPLHHFEAQRGTPRSSPTAQPVLALKILPCGMYAPGLQLLGILRGELVTCELPGWASSAVPALRNAAHDWGSPGLPGSGGAPAARPRRASCSPQSTCPIDPICSPQNRLVSPPAMVPALCARDQQGVVGAYMVVVTDRGWAAGATLDNPPRLPGCPPNWGLL